MPTKNLRILVVYGDPFALIISIKLLKTLSADNVETASDGESALQVCSRNKHQAKQERHGYLQPLWPYSYMKG